MKMKKIALLLLAVVSVSIVFGQTKQKIAVYVTGAEEGINEFVGTYLVNSIVSNRDYVAAERTAEFIKALNQYAETVSDEQISQFGKLFGIQLVCVAKIGAVSTQQFVSARLINVETATVIKSTKPVLFTIDNIDKSCAMVTADMFNGELFANNFEAAKTNEVKEPAKQEQPQPVYKITDSKSILTYSRSKVYRNGQRLSEDEVRSLMANSMEFNLYDRGMKQKKSGKIMLWVGAGAALAGIITLSATSTSYVGSDSHYDYYIYDSPGAAIAGMTLTSIGSTSLIVGGIVYCVGKKKIRSSIDQYNYRASSHSFLQLGATNNGLGFVYNF